MTDELDPDEEEMCPKCGSDRTHLVLAEHPAGEVIYQYCEDCGYQWNHG